MWSLSSNGGGSFTTLACTNRNVSWWACRLMRTWRRLLSLRMQRSQNIAILANSLFCSKSSSSPRQNSSIWLSSTSTKGKGNESILWRQMADLAAHLVGPSPTAAVIDAVRQCSKVNADAACCNEVWGARCQHLRTTLGMLQMHDVISWRGIRSSVLQCASSAPVFTDCLRTLMAQIDAKVCVGCPHDTVNPEKVARPKGSPKNRRLGKTRFVDTAARDGRHSSASRAARSLGTLPERAARAVEETRMLQDSA